MAMKGILCAVIFLHRVEDDKDFTETVNCIPDERAQELEEALKQMKEDGELDVVQMGCYRKDVHPLSDVYDQVDDFLDKIRLHSSTDRATPSEGEDDGSTPSEASNFTGFDDVPDFNPSNS